MELRRLTTLVVAVALFATACAPAGDESQTDTSPAPTEATTPEEEAPDTTPTAVGEQVTLTIWSWQDGFTDQWNRIFSVFEEQNPLIDIEFRGIAGTEYDTVLRTGLSTEGGPDVAFLRAYGLLQPLVAGGNIVAIDGTTQGLASLPDAILDGARGVEDGRIYGVPFALQTLQLFANQDLMNEHGVSVPATWDELMNACTTFRESGITPIAASLSSAWILPIYLAVFGATSYGGSDFKDELLAGDATFTDPRYVSAIENLAAVADGCFPDGAEGIDAGDAKTLFLSGNAAMHVAGSWDIVDFDEADFPIEVFPAPSTPDATVEARLTPGYVDGSIGINSDSPHREQALVLLEWLTSEEFGNLLMGELAQPSVVPGAESTSALLSTALDYYGENPAPYLEYSDFSFGSPDAWTLAMENLQAMLFGQATPQDVASALDRGVSQWFEPRG